MMEIRNKDLSKIIAKIYNIKSSEAFKLVL